MELYIFYNGYFYPQSAPLLSVLDRGLCFGDGLFELIRCIGGKFLLFDRHIQRMRKSAAFLEMPFPYRKDELLDYARKLVKVNGIKDGELYLEITRGEAPRYHEFPRDTKPNFFMVLNALRQMPENCREKGVKVITFPDIRWGYCHLKTINLLPNILAKEMAKKKGAYEALFIRGDEKGTYLTEGSSSSIFAIEGDVLITPEEDNILPGVTRAIVIEIAKQVNMKITERRLYMNEYKACDEAFLTSTVSEVLPVIRIDNKKIAKGIPGPKPEKLQSVYRSLMQSYLQ